MKTGNGSSLIRGVRAKFFFLTAFASSILLAQSPSTKLAASDWNLRRWSDILLGQVGVAHDPSGDVATVHVLRDSLPVNVSAVVQSQTPPFAGNSYLVSQFDFKAVNALGGVFNVYQREPSSAAAEYAVVPGGRRALVISYQKAGAGYCGMWMHLFNSATPPRSRVLFDASPFSYLTFWIRGRKGGEQVTLKVADAAWLARDDALPVGDVSTYLARRVIDTTWQVAVVPLSAFSPQINRRQLASIVFEAVGPASGQIMIKTLAFCVTRFPVPVLPSAAASRLPQRNLDKALWTWSADKILGDKAGEDELLNFLTQQHFNLLFLAIPYEPSDFRSLMGITLKPERFRRFLAACSAKHIRVDALIGDKNFVLPNQRQFVLGTIENIARYNAGVQPAERFTAVHLDVEGYLLPGFGGGRHGWIVDNYLALLEKAAESARAGGLGIGADIPFWFDNADEYSGEAELVSFHGVRKPLHEHVIDLMDNVVLMSYRTAAYGIDGIILHSSDEVAYATRTNKQAFVGLETGLLPDEDLMTFRGKPQTGLWTTQSTDQEVVLVPGPDSATVYVVSPRQRPAMENLLRTQGVAASTVLRWPVSQTTPVPGDRLSFASYPSSRISAVMNAAAIELSQSRGFRGFAIHYYESYVKLLAKGGR